MNNPEKKVRGGKIAMILAIAAISVTLIMAGIMITILINDGYNWEEDVIVLSILTFFLVSLPATGLLLKRLNQSWINISTIIVSAFVLHFSLIFGLIMIALAAAFAGF